VPGLFGPDLPEGASYRPDFISAAEEGELARAIGETEFSAFEMRGVVARRRVAFFGATYDLAREASGPIPGFLLPVRQRIAEWAGLEPEAFAMALINEYRAGAPIGWHRDAPQYGIIGGLSLLSSCRMKFRRYAAPRDIERGRTTPRKTTHELELLPRSAYLITGPARSQYEHSIPAVTTLRYSITFRTLRGT
jgi:alkylated DNA repair dioxygenase AlkB